MSNQTTFYLKYRPQKISELDNESVAEKLSAYLKTGNVPHAFLLVGHKGTGKTSSARIIAKAINCEDNIFAFSDVIPAKAGILKKENKIPDRASLVRNDKGGENSIDYEPCNKCEICKLITDGNDPDVLEIDAASNTSVEDIRDLRDKVRFSPTISRFKVYIIDEVHMISKSAFNALLKTLEEPPERTVFVLATTELEKVPDTIVSRCTVIEFKRADSNSIKKSIARIVKGEKLKISEDAVDSIISISSGSFRDAAKILEQAVYLAEGKEINADVINKITGGESGAEVYELLDYIINELNVGAQHVVPLQKNDNIKNAIRLIENLKEKNTDLRAFVKKVLEALHEVLLDQVGIVENREQRTENIAKKISQEQLKVIIENFEKAYQEMKFSDVMELPVELAIIDIMDSHGLDLQDSHGTDDTDNKSVKSEKSVPRESLVQISENPGDSKKLDLDVWKELINKVNSESKQLAGIMRSCKLNQKSETEFEIQAASKFHLERLSDGKAKDLFEKLGCEIVGRDVKIRSILLEK